MHAYLSTVFTVTPKPLPAQPLGSQFTLNCSSLMAAECFPSHVQWFLWVDPTGDGYGYVSNSKYLLPPGMTAVHSTGFTQLHITATRTTNRTLIVCRILAPNYNCASRQIQLVYYGEFSSSSAIDHTTLLSNTHHYLGLFPSKMVQ